MTYIYHEAYSISATIVTTFYLLKTNPQSSTHKCKPSHQVYFHDPPSKDDPNKRLIYAHYGDDYVNRNLVWMAEGLEVEAPPPPRRTSSAPECKGYEGRYEFRHTIGRPRNDNWNLYHIVLPQHCFVDRDNFENNTEDDLIVVTRKRRQSIDLVFREGLDLNVIPGLDYKSIIITKSVGIIDFIITKKVYNKP